LAEREDRRNRASRTIASVLLAIVVHRAAIYSLFPPHFHAERPASSGTTVSRGVDSERAIGNYAILSPLRCDCSAGAFRWDESFPEDVEIAPRVSRAERSFRGPAARLVSHRLVTVSPTSRTGEEESFRSKQWAINWLENSGNQSATVRDAA